MFLLAWLVAVLACFALAFGAVGEGLFARLVSGAANLPGDAQKGANLLAAATPTGTSVLAIVDGVNPQVLPVKAAIGSAAKDLAAMPGVVSVATPYLPPGTAVDPRDFVAKDGRAVLVTVTLQKGLGKDREAAIEALVTKRLQALDGELAGSTVTVGSLGALVEEITGQVKVDLRTGELIALPVSLVVMVLVFGGFLAAGLPIVGSIASVAGALGSLLAFSYVIDLDASVVSVVTVLGLGLSIDYGLLLVSRYREELRRLHDLGEDQPSQETLTGALEHTLTTAGRTVAFSGITVAISLSGLLLFRSDILRAVGAAGVSVVVVALLTALTLVPALLAVSARRLLHPGLLFRVPGLRRLTRRYGDVAPADGVFSRLARRVQRHPAGVAVGVLALLLVLAVPVLRILMINTGADVLPAGNPQRELFLGLGERFPATATPPVEVVTDGPASALEALSATVAALDGVASVDPVLTRADGNARAAVLGVRLKTDQNSSRALAVVQAIRDLPGSKGTFVTGQTAHLVDYLDDIKSRAPPAIALVVLATFVLLFLMTGSVLIPVKALIMNVVSLGASLGVTVWVFQEGHLSGPLGFTSAGGIDTTIPPLVLAFGFGLAMDYEVFLLSRIKEMRDAGLDNDEAVVAGLQRSGRIITSAALVMVIVFAGFAAGQLLIIKQMGVALAVAVALDATLVRMLLVPATMTLLGDWNWWAPGPMRRLHARFGLSEAPAEPSRRAVRTPRTGRGRQPAPEAGPPSRHPAGPAP